MGFDDVIFWLSNFGTLAFVAFADDILQGQINPKHDALSYFLKEENGEYPVIDRYQLKYISNYSFS